MRDRRDVPRYNWLEDAQLKAADVARARWAGSGSAHMAGVRAHFQSVLACGENIVPETCHMAAPIQVAILVRNTFCVMCTNTNHRLAGLPGQQLVRIMVWVMYRKHYFVAQCDPVQILVRTGSVFCTSANRGYQNHYYLVAAVPHGGPIQVAILVRNTVCVMYQNKPPLGGTAMAT